jgi:hypothetical protein
VLLVGILATSPGGIGQFNQSEAIIEARGNFSVSDLPCARRVPLHHTYHPPPYAEAAEQLSPLITAPYFQSKSSPTPIRFFPLLCVAVSILLRLRNVGVAPHARLSEYIKVVSLLFSAHRPEE